MGNPKHRSRPGSSSSTGSRGSGGGSRPGSRSNSRPGSRGQVDPPYMPWLKKEAKSEIGEGRGGSEEHEE